MQSMAAVSATKAEHTKPSAALREEIGAVNASEEPKGWQGVSHSFGNSERKMSSVRRQQEFH